MAGLSKAQRAVLEFMVQNAVRVLRYYPGPPGTEGRGAGWFFSGRIRDGAKRPALRSNTVEVLVAKGMLKWGGDGCADLTAAGIEVGDGCDV